MNSGYRIDLFDGFALDRARECLMRSGERIHLRRQSYEVLKFLVENKGSLITKDRLIEEIWHGRAVTDSSLVKCIEEVREALGPNASQFVRTVRGRGYIFDPEIEQPSTPTNAVGVEHIDVVSVTVEDHVEIPEPSAAVSTSSASASRVKTGTAAVTVLLLLAAIATGSIYWFISHHQPKTRATAVPFSAIDVSRVTTSGIITHAAISSDGRYVASVMKDANGNSIWVKNVGAPSNVRIAGPAATEYISVAFVPNSNNIYYIALDHDKGESTLYRVSALGGASELVANDIYPVGFAADGKRIAFIRFQQSESHLVVADVDGLNQRDIAARQKPDAFELEWNAPAWSPDGKTIVVPARLNDPQGHFGTIIGVNAADGSQTQLTSMRWNYVGQPVWLADGSGLLLPASDRPGSPMAVWYVSLPGGEATRITHDLNNYQDLTITTDMSRLSAVQIQAVSSIWVADADASTVRQVKSETGSLEVLAWTRDGRVVYRSSAGGNGADIWIMNADGSNAKQLTVGSRASRGLAVTPDGRHIIFSSDVSGQFNLWRVDTDGGNLKQLTAGDGEFYPDCTPDGRWVVYQVNEVIDPRIWKVPIDGGQSVQLVNSRATKPAVSPDGQVIAYSYLDIELNPSRWGIGIVSAEGGERLRRFDFPSTVTERRVRWAPDGKSIAFLNSPGGLSDIWLQPLDGTAPKPLTNLKSERIIAFEWSPDGHSLALIRSVQTSDVITIERAH